MVKYPTLIVNFKAYEKATGGGSLQLCQDLARVREETGQEIVAVPQFFELKECSGLVPCFSQHVDAIGFGSNTGHVLPQGAKAAGAIGSLINHSERRVGIKEIGEIVAKCKEAGLVACVCAENAEECGKVAALGPDMIAVEPPELIGSGVSVSTAQPEVVSGAVEAVKAVNPEVHVLCGAGVSNGEDVAAAVKLGAEGVLVASAIVCAESPYGVALEMAEKLEGKS